MIQNEIYHIYILNRFQQHTPGFYYVDFNPFKYREERNKPIGFNATGEEKVAERVVVVGVCTICHQQEHDGSIIYSGTSLIK